MSKQIHSTFFDTDCWPAPGKLNLFLHITGRRDDGYHLLQTMFQFFDYGDSLYFDINNNGQLKRLTDIDGVSEEQDLIIRAAKMLQETSGCSKGVDIKLSKRLPMGGGIGGGSSDAATTLVALNQLWGVNMNLDELAKIGIKLGADVPIFIHGQAAWAEGIGEKINYLDTTEPYYLIIKPDCSVPTAQIFSHPGLTRDSQKLKMSAFRRGLGNDCEEVVRSLYPQVAEALDWLSGYQTAELTGTGACIFAAFDTKEQAEKVAGKAPAKWDTIVARGLNCSPLNIRAQKVNSKISAQ
ncbi:MAG: 4-(cytidine 5'-diphospho)-2-C-methyl-D-erythritol kinase [Gammaproteobacteria bacterium]|nr:MAG: 4-(cytidine 5'-diphospho)-2-C-methyl-D-erythritol kinase [Gammaproteobacteria bacterium]